MHGLERRGDGVIVGGVGVAERIGPLVVHHRRLGGDGEERRGILSHQITVVRRQDGAAGHGGARGHIHHGAGGEHRLDAAGQHQHAGAGGAGEDVGLLQPGLLPRRGSGRAGAVRQRIVGLIQLFIHPAVHLVGEGAGEVGEGGQGIGGPAAGRQGGHGDGGQEAGRQQPGLGLSGHRKAPFSTSGVSGSQCGN